MGTGSSSLPAWTGSVQKMTLKDGHYELTLDISSCPQLQDTSWSFPDNQWSYKLAPDGRSVTFQYNGNQEPQGTIMSAQIQGSRKPDFSMLISLPLLHLKTFRSSWDGWILTGPWHLSPFRLEQMRFCRAAVIWNYTAILKHFRAITTLIWRNIVLRRINRWRERCSTCGEDFDFCSGK